MSAELLREAAGLLLDGAESLPERFLIEITDDTPEDMHPIVARALAAWLIRAAEADEQFRLPSGPGEFPMAVARAVLGRDS